MRSGRRTEASSSCEWSATHATCARPETARQRLHRPLPQAAESPLCSQLQIGEHDPHPWPPPGSGGRLGPWQPLDGGDAPSGAAGRAQQAPGPRCRPHMQRLQRLQHGGRPARASGTGSRMDWRRGSRGSGHPSPCLPARSPPRAARRLIPWPGCRHPRTPPSPASPRRRPCCTPRRRRSLRRRLRRLRWPSCPPVCARPFVGTSRHGSTAA